jgi:ABC-type multidrug transport system ATPase subunit
VDELALDIEALAKRYPTGVEALREVSLRIKPGELFALLGPNGAGKSTLIHCTTGLAQPTGGSIHVFGHDATGDYGKARQAVGLAPQEPNLDWFLTVAETLDYHAGYFGMPKRDHGAARDLLADREARRTHPHPLGWDEEAPDPGPGDDAQAAPLDPRRAHRRG